MFTWNKCPQINNLAADRPKRSRSPETDIQSLTLKHTGFPQFPVVSEPEWQAAGAFTAPVSADAVLGTEMLFPSQGGSSDPSGKTTFSGASGSHSFLCP